MDPYLYTKTVSKVTKTTRDTTIKINTLISKAERRAVKQGEEY